MTEDRQKRGIRSDIRGSVVGQAAGLALWPLLTVILVVGTLYYDKVRDLEETTAQKELLIVKSAGHALKTGSQAVFSDLTLLAGSAPLRTYLATSDPSSLAQLKEALFSVSRKNPAYKRIRLLSLDGTVVVSAPQQEETLPGSVPTETAQKDQAIIEAMLGRPAGAIALFPSLLHLAFDRPIDSSVPPLSFMVYVTGAEKMQGGIVVLDYHLPLVLAATGERGNKESGSLYVIDEELFSTGTASGSIHSEHSELLDRLSPALVGFDSRNMAPLFQDGHLYSFAYADLFSGNEALEKEAATVSTSAVQPPSGYRRLLVSETPAAYFSSQKRDYMEFFLVLAAALLIPSLVVCFFLAKTKMRVREEAESRYLEQVEHLAELEGKVRQRTRELDDRNVRLSGEIAERLSAENRLRQSNELLSGMLESLDGIIYVADFDTHEILFANEYLKDLFGLDPVGKKCWQFIHSSQDGPCVFCTNHNLLDLQGEPTGSYQWEYQNPFNKKWYAAKDLAIMWSNGKYVKLEIATDISDQKQMQHFLNEARRQAELAQGIRSRFVALVAHDLKSPFFSITQMLKRILERETFTYKVHRQFLENFVENGHRMLLMIDNLLSMDRFESTEVKLEKTFFDVSVMGGEVLQNFNHLAFEKGVSLINFIPPATQIFADRYLYFVVLNNLLSNAIKFSEPGGTIELSVPDPENPMTIAVSDNGKGMSMEYARNLFKADVKTSSRGTKGEKGSGLGLIFCQEILKAHHGVIEVESERGVGTVFHITLPGCCNVANGTFPGIGGLQTTIEPLPVVQTDDDQTV